MLREKEKKKEKRERERERRERGELIAKYLTYENRCIRLFLYIVFFTSLSQGLPTISVI